MEAITSKPIKPYSALLIISQCALHRKYSLCTLARRFCVSRKGGTGGGGGGGRHQQGDMHMVAARLGFERGMVSTRWATSRLTTWTGLENTTLTLYIEGWFLARTATWALSECMVTSSADYYMLINECAWSKSRVCLLRPEVDMGLVLESELGQKWR